ncbi:MAG: hypothetical protein LQ349_008984 [Xanthoria aureola]|nr:MAG: hypothetical protein LQ349_008984 [Xanthoria aureola]
MSQDSVNKTAPRHHYAGALATKFDPSVFGKMASNAAESSKAAGDKISSDRPESSKVVSSKNISSSADPSKATTSRNISNTTEPSKPASSKMVSNGAESSRATSKQNKPPSTAPKTREQKIAEVLGYPPQPKGGKISWTQPSQTSQTSSSKHIPSAASSHRAVSQEPSKLSAGAHPPPPAGSASQTSKFPCPYTDCTRGFLKEGDLRKHKMQDHDYCKICDEDFEDEEAFHKHKIMSERHITCTVCSLDFKSESGRDRHHKVMHAASHNVKCRGCDTTFAKGAALIHHFEKNLCRPTDKEAITADRFEAQRASLAMLAERKDRERAFQSEKTGGSPSEMGSVAFEGSGAGSSVHGGVPIEASEQPDFLTDRSLEFPAPSELSDTTERPLSPVESDAGSDLLSFHDDPRDALNASNLAALDQGGRMAQVGLADWPPLGSRTDVVKGISNLSMSAAKPAPAGESPRIYAPPSVQPSKSGYSVAEEMKKYELLPNPATGEWDCPYHKCKFTALRRQDLDVHLDDRNQNGHLGFGLQCPSCLKRFKTASAMVAHFESPTVRCNIRDSKEYSEILYFVSGGHLDVSGRHSDGTNRLVVPKDPVKTIESMLR